MDPNEGIQEYKKITERIRKEQCFRKMSISMNSDDENHISMKADKKNVNHINPKGSHEHLQTSAQTHNICYEPVSKNISLLTKRAVKARIAPQIIDASCTDGSNLPSQCNDEESVLSVDLPGHMPKDVVVNNEETRLGAQCEDYSLSYRENTPSSSVRKDDTPKLLSTNVKSPKRITSKINLEEKSSFFSFSPLLNDSYKYETIFDFPDINSPSEMVYGHNRASKFFNNNNINSCKDEKAYSMNIGGKNESSNVDKTTTTLKNIEISGNSTDNNLLSTQYKDDCDKKSYENTRRTRLKSISLDSDGAKLVEENLYIPVEELVERVATTLYKEDSSNSIKCCKYFDIKDTNENVNDNQNKDALKQKKHSEENDLMSITLSIDSCNIIEMNNYSSYKGSDTPKTPTLTETRHKAASLDSEFHKSSKSPRTDNETGTQYAFSDTDLLQILSESSTSEPTTPKLSFENEPNVLDTNLQNTQINRQSMLTQNSGLNQNISDPQCYDNGIALELDSTNRKGLLSSVTFTTSNINLESLPEVITVKEEGNISDSHDTKTNDVTAENSLSVGEHKQFTEKFSEDQGNYNICGSVNNLFRHGGGAGLSLSNYSLSNLQGSHCSLSRSNYSIYGSGNTNSKIKINPMDSYKCKGLSKKKFASKTPSNTSSNAAYPITMESKKNLLQRRGSNASLTLNIVRDNNSLNRFNSHSSLNIITTPYDASRITSVNTKRGLLERGNSNTSLALNIQKRALSSSNCNFRDSNSSLGSIPNNYEKSIDESKMCSYCGGTSLQKMNSYRVDNSFKSNFISLESNHHQSQVEKANHNNDLYKHTEYVPNIYHRKFLSSENLYKHHSYQLRQSSEKSESVDYTLHGSNIDLNRMKNTDNCSGLNKQCYCQCSNVTGRSISTKPLSPQATSEEFKIYLASIQMLQNASNSLLYAELTKLNYVFERSYINQNQKKDIDIVNVCTLSEPEQNALLTSIHQEFWDLPTNYQEKPMVLGSQVKNRYKTILPNEHSRAFLQGELMIETVTPAKQRIMRVDAYVNANLIKGPDFSLNAYIATQGPMVNTIYDFWLMVYHNAKCAYSSPKYNHGQPVLMNYFPDRHQKIVMLTDIIENDESKCAIYFPQNLGNSLYFINKNIIESREEKNLLSALELFYSNDENWNSDIGMPTDGKNFNYFCIRNCGINYKNGYSIRKLECLYRCYKRKQNENDNISDEDSNSSADDEEDDDYEKEEEEKEEVKLCPELNHFFVYHYWFQQWPDHRSPENIDVVLDMCLDIIDSDCDEYFKCDNNGSLKIIPIESRTNLQDSHKENDAELQDISDNKTADDRTSLVPLHIIHCSAGIGRTGCVAGILNGLHQIRSSAIKAKTKGDIAKISVDILGIVSNLRLQRGGMVQNSEQYELIHRTLCLYLQNLIKLYNF